ncbi:hypothetical protein CHS0354_038812 [Potamilus streckersoni]|uniref:Uncharacterized protein n=1 Tax=Potamilus streckersoni TaxID=2493646 RepID=A0AAE0THN8_9BIVA|nr:hypothetical protein CHS0354_038812 [Potamilus streckersoni]
MFSPLLEKVTDQNFSRSFFYSFPGLSYGAGYTECWWAFKQTVCGGDFPGRFGAQKLMQASMLFRPAQTCDCPVLSHPIVDIWTLELIEKFQELKDKVIQLEKSNKAIQSCLDTLCGVGDGEKTFCPLCQRFVGQINPKISTDLVQMVVFDLEICSAFESQTGCLVQFLHKSTPHSAENPTLNQSSVKST